MRPEALDRRTGEVDEQQHRERTERRESGDDRCMQDLRTECEQRWHHQRCPSSTPGSCQPWVPATQPTARPRSPGEARESTDAARHARTLTHLRSMPERPAAGLGQRRFTLDRRTGGRLSIRCRAMAVGRHVPESSRLWPSGGVHLWSSGGTSPEQTHARGHLVYAARGVLSVHTERGTSIVPANRVAWTPAGFSHYHRAHGHTDMRIVFLPASLARLVPGHPAVFTASDLAREILLSLTGPRDHDRAARAPLHPRPRPPPPASARRRTPRGTRATTPAAGTTRRPVAGHRAKAVREPRGHHPTGRPRADDRSQRPHAQPAVPRRTRHDLLRVAHAATRLSRARPPRR